MKKFEFKLEPLLKIRRFDEKQQYIEFAKVLVKHNQNNSEIQSTTKISRSTLAKESRLMKTGKFDLAYSLSVRKYLNQLSKKSVIAVRKNQEIMPEYQKKLKAANEARLKRRTLEILKEKKLVKYKLEQNRIETKMLDDFNQNSRGRRISNDNGKIGK